MARGGITVSTKGLAELSRKLDKLPKAIVDGARAAVAEETKDVADDMRKHAPRDTGELAESIQTEIGGDGLTGTAAATARHATFVEYGTSDTPEQPFAMPAAMRSRNRFWRRVRKAVGGKLEDLVK